MADSQPMTEPDFKTVATAIAFSPYLEANLHESTRIADMLGSNILLIHVGKKTKEKEAELNRVLEGTGLDTSRVTTIWKEGDPTETILNACDEHNVDLLLAGAKKKEGLLTFYIGSVARKLSRNAKCSIMILPMRSVVRNPCKTIVVNGMDHPKTEASINAANHVGNALGASKMVIVDEVDPDKVNASADDDEETERASKIRNEIVTRENARLTELSKDLQGEMRVSTQVIFGKAGYTIGHIAQSMKADLLVVNSPDKQFGLLDRVFQHDIEYLLGDMPCCLLIVNQKNA